MMLQRRTLLATYLFKHGQSLYCAKDFHLTRSVLIRKRGATMKTSPELDSYSTKPATGEFPVLPKTNINANFYGVESDEGVIDIEKRSRNTILEQDVFISRHNNELNRDKVKNTRFGTVRWDNENKPMLQGSESTKSFVDQNAKTYDRRTLSPLHALENQVDHLHLESDGINDKHIYSKCDENSDTKIGVSYIDDIYFSNEVFDAKSSEKPDFKHSSKMVDYLDHGKTSFTNEFISSKSSYDFVENPSSDSKNQGILGGTNSKDGLVFLDELYFKNESVQNVKDGLSKNPKHLKTNVANEGFSFIDESYFDSKLIHGNKYSTKDLEENNSVQNVNEEYSNNPKHLKTNVENEGFSFIDESYFDSSLINDNKHSKKDLEESVDVHSRSIKSPPVGFTSEGYDDFSEIPIVQNEPKKINNEYITKDQLNNSESNQEFRDVNSDIAFGNLYNKTVSSPLSFNNNNKTSNSIEENLVMQSPMVNHKVNDPHKVVTNVKEKLSASSRTNLSDITKRFEKSQEPDLPFKTDLPLQETKMGKVNSANDPDTAYDFIQKLRNEKREECRPIIKGGKYLPPETKQDSKGFRILSNQVPNLSSFTKDEIMTILKNSILYSDEDIVVLNKPYNLVIHDSETTKDPALSEYLDELAVALDDQSQNPKLITVHRIDKETCGCLLLARNEAAAERLRTMFAQRKIVKTYWIVTIAVPDPLEGVIDIPITEGSVGRMRRMVLHPKLPKDVAYASHSKHGKRAVTYYKVVSTSGSAAIVEVQPETGLKHQIRVHFGFGLSCPILGDHKYSYLDRMAPQKLPSDMLQRLCIRQSKVRHVPMHIYARSVLIPNYRDDRNLYVMAPMPLHISKNLQKLKFRKK